MNPGPLSSEGYRVWDSLALCRSRPGIRLTVEEVPDSKVGPFRTSIFPPAMVD
jgi:hypothetical protein